MDDGVQTDHPDLAGNIISGFDFYENDSDPNPTGTYNNHGTAVAGVAAAAVNNSTGVAGVAGRCKILPVRLYDTYDAQGHFYLPDSATVYRALVYAADNADVLSCSWGTSFNGTIHSGFSYAYSDGRAGKGCAVLCASGNAAGGDGLNSYGVLKSVNLYSYFGGGSFYIAFVYGKNASASGYDDCFWLADGTLPNGTKQRFDGPTLPTGWTTGGNANWTTSIDPVHAHGTTGYAWRSGAIGDNQYSAFYSPATAVSTSQTTVTFRNWISSEIGDRALLYVYDSMGQLLNPQFLIGEGPVANRTTAVAFPANLYTVLAVGASSDFNYRSYYSQYDSMLDFVAPSSGGYGGIWTTDRTGAAGYDSGDYIGGFGGTSASAPEAAGIAALVLSKDGNLTRASVADKLIQTCDKVGPVAYTGSPSRNDYYGYGRLNAQAAVNATTADTTPPTFTSTAVMNYRAVDVNFSEPMGDGVLTPGSYQITAGQGTLSSNPSKVVRILPTAYRLIWNSGDIATSGTVTIQVSSAIKDVAGNAVTGTLSRNSSGTKRIVAINCGEKSGLSGRVAPYTPPFIADNGFQGNEANPVLTVTSDTGHGYYSGGVNYYGVVDPAPMAVYQSTRTLCYSDQTMVYSIPNIPSGSSYNVRLHFSQNYFNQIAQEVFDIYVNGSLVYGGFDILAQTGGQMYTAYIQTFNNVSPVSGTITVILDPRTQGYNSASICGIEIVKL